jgi:hypothetical protein
MGQKAKLPEVAQFVFDSCNDLYPGDPSTCCVVASALQESKFTINVRGLGCVAPVLDGGTPADAGKDGGKDGGKDAGIKDAGVKDGGKKDGGVVVVDAGKSKDAGDAAVEPDDAGGEDDDGGAVSDSGGINPPTGGSVNGCSCAVVEL